MKTEIGPKNLLYPLPTVLVGATVDGKPNFITIAHVGILSPGCVSLGVNKIHYSNHGIRSNETFSVNIPSTNLVKETDYCGLVTGKCEDKSSKFKVFYGKLETAPMIEECPVNMECKLVKTVDFPNHDIFMGEVVSTYYDESVLTDGKVDLTKLDPILFGMSDKGYYKIGKRIANAWDIGKELKEGKC